MSLCLLVWGLQGVRDRSIGSYRHDQRFLLQALQYVRQGSSL